MYKVSIQCCVQVAMKLYHKTRVDLSVVCIAVWMTTMLLHRLQRKGGKGSVQRLNLATL